MNCLELLHKLHNDFLNAKGGLTSNGDDANYWRNRAIMMGNPKVIALFEKFHQKATSFKQSILTYSIGEKFILDCNQSLEMSNRGSALICIHGPEVIYLARPDGPWDFQVYDRSHGGRVWLFSCTVVQGKIVDYELPVVEVL